MFAKIVTRRRAYYGSAKNAKKLFRSGINGFLTMAIDRSRAGLRAAAAFADYEHFSGNYIRRGRPRNPMRK
jgi:hypothetical protein